MMVKTMTAAMLLAVQSAMATVTVSQTVDYRGCLVESVCGLVSDSAHAVLSVTMVLPDASSLYAGDGVTLSSGYQYHWQSIDYSWTVNGVDATALLLPLRYVQFNYLSPEPYFGASPNHDSVYLLFEAMGPITQNFGSYSAIYSTGGGAPPIGFQLIGSFGVKTLSVIGDLSPPPAVPEPGTAWILGAGTLIIVSLKARSA